MGGGSAATRSAARRLRPLRSFPRLNDQIWEATHARQRTQKSEKHAEDQESLQKSERRAKRVIEEAKSNGAQDSTKQIS
jgi:hypothetical protein